MQLALGYIFLLVVILAFVYAIFRPWLAFVLIIAFPVFEQSILCQKTEKPPSTPACPICSSSPSRYRRWRKPCSADDLDWSGQRCSRRHTTAHIHNARPDSPIP